MTDNEIIKALECCNNYVFQHCVQCPLCGTTEFIPCEKRLGVLALDLINRQKAQIIKEQNKNSKLRNERNRQKAEIENYSHNNRTMTDSIYKLQKALEQAKAEIDDLKRVANKYKRYYFNHEYDELENRAIKEFAERLKAKEKVNNVGDGYVHSWDITNLVKEMVGDTD